MDLFTEADITRTVHLQFEEVDSTTLRRLCDAFDSSLEALGKAFDVQISRHFEHFTFMSELTHTGHRVLLSLAGATEKDDLDDNTISLMVAEAKATNEKHEGKHHDQQYYFRTKRGSIGGRTPRQNGYIRALLSRNVVFDLGLADTNKTYLAIATAVDTIEKHQIERIVLMRPAVEAGEKLGFLPGNLAQKVDPCLRPLYGALCDLMGFDRVTKLMEKGLVKITPLVYMRGRTLNDAYAILDEAQDTTPEQMKMFLTHIGFGAKAVITGDISQIDLPHNTKSDLKDAHEKLRDVEGLYFHTFTSEDIVRHPLVQKIVEAYEATGERVGEKNDE